MSRMRDVFRNRDRGPSLFEGVIATDAETAHDLVYVTIAAFDEELTWGPSPFIPRIDITGEMVLPSFGDRCIVGLAETIDPGEPSIWILGYSVNE
jgi:hypothetical protein